MALRSAEASLNRNGVVTALGRPAAMIDTVGHEYLIRACCEDDLEAVNDLYGHHVRISHATFDLEEPSLRWRREWLAAHSTPRHLVLVAEDDDRILGYCSSSRYRPRAAYDTSVETSVYVAPNATGRGVATALYRALFGALDGQDVHRALAGIALPNDASVALHRAFGFRPVGTFTEQGRKFGRYWDVAWYERDMTLTLPR